MYSFSCQICGVDMAIARIRTPDEPTSAAWNWEGANYVGAHTWPCQEEFQDQDCQECTTIIRPPADGPDLETWPNQEDQDEADWAPGGHPLSNDDDPLEYDSGWESQSSNHEDPNHSGDESYHGEMDSHDSDGKSDCAPLQYPLRDLFAPPLPERLPHGTWYDGFVYYTGDRKTRQLSPLSHSGISQVLPEHIASSSCQSLQGINGHVLSVEQMKNCRNVRFLVPKPSHWRAEASDQLIEGDSLFYLSGESNGSHMVENRHFRGWHSLYPPRHALTEIGTSWEYVNEGCINLTESFVPLPVHSYCMDVYAKTSFRRFGRVDLNGLWHWREMRSEPDLYGLADRIPRQRPELEQARESWDYPWCHLAGDEWLTANPVELPGISRALETCLNRPSEHHIQLPDSRFLALPAEIIQHTLSFLDLFTLDTMAKISRSLYKLTQPVFRASVVRDMPWLWELFEGSEYPASRDCLPTWDPLCPLGVAPPILPIGLESEEDEAARWVEILLENPEMEELCNAVKMLNRQRRDEVLAPYYARKEASLNDWHRFRASVEAWIQRNSQNAARHCGDEDINWRRLWLLFNPATSPLPGIRNRARIWDDCEKILDCVTLAHELGDIDERHEELCAKISEYSQGISYTLPDERPNIPEWL